MSRLDNESGVSHVLVVPESGAGTELAVAALTEFQVLASKRRADAEALLAEARAVERRVAEERDLLAGLAAGAAAARLAERDADEQVRAARENFETIAAMRQAEIARYAELRAAEEAATADFERIQESLRIAQRRLDDAARARLAHPAPSTEPWPHEAEAGAGYDAAVIYFEQCRAARTRADADVAELQVRLGFLSGTNGLEAGAVKRVLERRMADELRNGMKPV
jgi:hypothetical protein